jgi:diguanylate cyclase (GGDEF)-like protein
MDLQPLRFLSSAIDRSSALAETHAPFLVVAAIVVAFGAGYVLFGALERMRTHESTMARKGWVVAGGLAGGIGLWAADAIAWLALTLPVARTYDLGGVLLAAAAAAAGCIGALLLAAPERATLGRRLAAGATAGAAIALAHYLGVIAINNEVTVFFAPVPFILAIAVAVVGSIAAFELEFRLPGVEPGRFDGGRLAAGATFGSAIVLSHYTSALASSYFPAGQPRVADALDALAIGALAGSAAVLALGLVAVAVSFDRRLVRTRRMAGQSRALLVDATDSLPDGLAILDANGHIVLANAGLRRLFPSLDRQTGAAVRYDDVFPAYLRGVRSARGVSYDAFASLSRRTDDYVETEASLGDGRIMVVRDQRTPSGSFVLGFADVTSARQFQKQLEHLALHDSLTGLPNRVLFEDRLTLAAAQVRRRRTSLAVLYIDLDLFKPVNDSFGHDGGDAVLREIGRRLLALLRSTDTAARIGGDEFAVILQPDVDAQVAAKVGARIVDELARPIAIGNGTARVTASIGYAIYPQHNDDLNALMQLADAAMYRAKQAGGSRLVAHEEEPAPTSVATA